jgi:hypothetical protein
VAEAEQALKSKEADHAAAIKALEGQLAALQAAMAQVWGLGWRACLWYGVLWQPACWAAMQEILKHMLVLAAMWLQCHVSNKGVNIQQRASFSLAAAHHPETEKGIRPV